MVSTRVGCRQVHPPKEVTYRHVGQITEMEKAEREAERYCRGSCVLTVWDCWFSGWPNPSSQMSEICLRAAPNCRRLRQTDSEAGCPKLNCCNLSVFIFWDRSVPPIWEWWATCVKSAYQLIRSVVLLIWASSSVH